MQICEIKDPICSVVKVTKDNLFEVIQFLGQDFIAITSGAPIVVSNTNVQFSDDCTLANIIPDLERGMVVFLKKLSKAEIQIAPMNTYIVYSNIHGYSVMSEDTFLKYYNIIEPPESPDDERDVTE